MPEIISTSTIDLPYKINQSELKKFARKVFSSSFKDIDRLLESFDNARIDTRNLCVPLDYFFSNITFQERNALYIDLALKYSVEAIEMCLNKAGVEKKEITDLIFISTTGIAAPSIDALIINEMKLDLNINRTPIWGLGCAGGVAGIAKANIAAKANPKAIVMLVAVELCSLTFIRNDLSKSNLIATGLFSDGISAVLIKGDEAEVDYRSVLSLSIIDSRSKIYYDSLDVMGWDILDSGFKVVFSKDIPSIVNKNVKDDVVQFLDKHDLQIKDIKNFITHPGGIKVIDAYVDALNICPELLNNTRSILKQYGNMSSTTVIYVLNKFIDEGINEGYGLMTSLGPGFSNEMALLNFKS